jgi:hypothetical protein
MARKHDASDLGGGVDLHPMSRFKGMKSGILSLGPQVFGDGEMEVGVCLPPDEQEGNLGAPELDHAGRSGRDLVGQLVSHLREGRTGARLLPEVVVDDRPEELHLAGSLRLGDVRRHLLTLKSEQPGKLLRAFQKMETEGFQLLIGEKLDQFGNPK